MRVRLRWPSPCGAPGGRKGVCLVWKKAGFGWLKVRCWRISTENTGWNCSFLMHVCAFLQSRERAVNWIRGGLWGSLSTAFHSFPVYLFHANPRIAGKVNKRHVRIFQQGRQNNGSGMKQQGPFNSSHVSKICSALWCAIGQLLANSIHLVPFEISNSNTFGHGYLIWLTFFVDFFMIYIGLHYFFSIACLSRAYDVQSSSVTIGFD